MSDAPTQSNPLDDLFLDKGEAVDSALVAQILKPYVRFYSDTKEIITNENWETLNLQKRVVVWMLAVKALRLKDLIDEEEEKVTPSDITKATGIVSGSVRPTLSKLLDSRFIRLDKTSGKYYIPDHAVTRISQLLSSE